MDALCSSGLRTVSSSLGVFVAGTPMVSVTLGLSCAYINFVFRHLLGFCVAGAGGTKGEREGERKRGGGQNSRIGIQMGLVAYSNRTTVYPSMSNTAWGLSSLSGSSLVALGSAEVWTRVRVFYFAASA